MDKFAARRFVQRDGGRDASLCDAFALIDEVPECESDLRHERDAVGFQQEDEERANDVGLTPKR